MSSERMTYIVLIIKNKHIILSELHLFVVFCLWATERNPQAKLNRPFRTFVTDPQFMIVKSGGLIPIRPVTPPVYTN
ncbi:hypothetical protein M2135_000138 [Parabacteroides sp. PF5-9]|nr:hypothetical protein [Parabacteroides sp. PF5-9]